MNLSEFITKVGRMPQHDDLERVNCEQAGNPGHFMCGFCWIHNLPRFECGCMNVRQKNDLQPK